MIVSGDVLCYQVHTYNTCTQAASLRLHRAECTDRLATQLNCPISSYISYWKSYHARPASQLSASHTFPGPPRCPASHIRRELGNLSTPQHSGKWRDSRVREGRGSILGSLRICTPPRQLLTCVPLRKATTVATSPVMCAE